MHFIVTGGAGFIGSHVTEQLLLAGHRVTVVDNLSTGQWHNLRSHANLQFLQKDICACQPDDFTEPIDGIAHLAATPSVIQSWQQPLEAHHNNLSATVAVIELCQTLNIPRLVTTSSAAVYGNPLQASIREDHPTAPISPYGLQKLMSEQYANLFAQHDGFSVINLRLFNVFGPRQRPDSHYSGVISIFTKAMQAGLPITIYGDGTQTRDFIYVKDVAIAFAKALTLPLPSSSSLVCNIGTGHAISLNELVDVLKAHFPTWRSQICYAPARPGDIQDSRADITKAETLFDFQPSAFRACIQEFLETLTTQTR
ncbi:MAG: SDR family NAD(P)-dependent oxidoreductase [Elainellaceae cyanobacterium]